MKKRIHTQERRAQPKVTRKYLKSAFTNSTGSFNVAASVVSVVCSGSSLYR